MSLFTKLFGDPNKKAIQRLQPLVDQVNAHEAVFSALSDDDLRETTTKLKEKLASGKTLDDILPEAFAAVREAAKRALGQRHFDVQLLGGIVLHKGSIAEMRTGEGKTLTSTLPAYLNALAGKGVHVVTVNDYLARRDAVWMGQVFHKLGVSVGIIQQLGVSFAYDPAYKAPEKEVPKEGEPQEADTTGVYKVEEACLKPCTRQESYRCDITYGTNNEFGFDYLRDNMVQDLSQCVQRGHAYAIIDEVDSILIDEARTPLIISAPAQEAGELYYKFAELIGRLQPDADYNVDEKMRAATLTEAGIQKIEEWLNMGNIYTEGGIKMVHHMEQALKARALFHKDKEYVVDGKEIVIVDEFTGRKMYGRRFSEGLHQAIEAKEGLPIQRESQTLATITFQNFFRIYKKLSGMTGTAVTEAEEFGNIYKLEVVVIPTNRGLQRHDERDRVYKSEEAKFKAVVERVKEARAAGQPVLLGTISIEKNEQLSELLKAEGIPHEMLNAKNHQREGEIIAQAGRPGAVTLATNMAGRGVDIILGGNPPVPEDAQKVRETGGLFVIGTERHESRRIDNQLRGRAGRQGDPGRTQFFVSVEDDLMRIFAGDRVKRMMNALKLPDDMPIENGLVTRALEEAQKKVEGHNFDIRKHLLEYDDVLNKHREAIYKKRQAILEISKSATEGVQTDVPQTLRDMVFEMVDKEIEHVVTFHTSKQRGDWDPKEIVETVETMFSLRTEARDKLRAVTVPGKSGYDDAVVRTDLIELLTAEARYAYGELEKTIANPALMREIEKAVLLRAIDMLWVEHLVTIDHVRTGIGLRGYGQRDPLVEYKKEAFRLYHQLLDSIVKEVAYTIFKATVGIQMTPSVYDNRNASFSGAAKTMRESAVGAAALSDVVSPVVEKPRDTDGQKIGRNDPCFCGSGKKFKHCHGK